MLHLGDAPMLRRVLTVIGALSRGMPDGSYVSVHPLATGPRGYNDRLDAGASGVLAEPAGVQAGSGYDNHQGVDSCFVPTTTDLNNFWAVPAFFNYGWYLGGAEAHDVGCAPWSTSLLSAARTQGWGFFPIWDDLQAPAGCGPIVNGHRVYFADPMSLTTSTARAEGNTAGTNAESTMTARGFGTIDEVWLDVEGYDTSQPNCVAAVNAYVDGWDTVVAANAGVYGSPCGSDMNSRAGLAHVPQAIDWAYPGGSLNSVWGAPCITSNSRWVEDQRMHQYRLTDCHVTGDCINKPYDVDYANAFIDGGTLTGEPGTEETVETTSPTAEPTCFGTTQP